MLVPAGGGPAGRAPLWRSLARSTADSRDGTVLIRHPPMLRCTVVVSIQKLTCWPVLLVPSQNCCGPTVMFPDGGTTRSTSTASGQHDRLRIRWRLRSAGCRGA